MRVVSTVLVFWFVVAFAPYGGAFSLLGPLKNATNGAPDPWQGKPYGGREGGLGYGLPNDIGGPMFIHEAYRWNVPVLYYGFDQSFLDYFGEEGVEAVEQAFAILNALPPASQMSQDLVEFPLDSKSENSSGAALGLIDLKSHVLALVIEQLGLAEPERFVWGLRNRQASSSSTNYVVVGMNYDPTTYSASSWVNGVRYEYKIFDYFGSNAPWASAVEWFELDPLLAAYSSVASAAGGWDFELGSDNLGFPSFYSGLNFGQYFTGLTRDDVGGLRFLLHPDHRQREPLLPGVTGAGTNTSNFVNVAQRGGVDKINFTRLALAAGSPSFQPVTNVFFDTYLTNDLVVTQMLKRVVTKPDLLFQTKDLGMDFYHVPDGDYWIYPKPMVRSDTSGWQNNSVMNGQPGKGGPGIIHPPATFTFNSAPGRYARAGAGYPNWLYGTFDGSDADPIVYQGNETNIVSILLDTRIAVIDGIRQFKSTYLARPWYTYRVETSTNLVNWEAWYWLDNAFGTFSVIDWLDQPKRFYRVIRETWSQNVLDEERPTTGSKP